ncbi:TPA: hypothetical protein DF272_04530 [Candidatus Falkowbacteria bacterium]|nr:hypothetical protein [Candidatus Falkowbacteria bacterium]
MKRGEKWLFSVFRFWHWGSRILDQKYALFVVIGLVVSVGLIGKVDERVGSVVDVILMVSAVLAVTAAGVTFLWFKVYLIGRYKLTAEGTQTKFLYFVVERRSGNLLLMTESWTGGFYLFELDEPRYEPWIKFRPHIDGQKMIVEFRLVFHFVDVRDLLNRVLAERLFKVENNYVSFDFPRIFDHKFRASFESFMSELRETDGHNFQARIDAAVEMIYRKFGHDYDGEVYLHQVEIKIYKEAAECDQPEKIIDDHSKKAHLKLVN